MRRVSGRVVGGKVVLAEPLPEGVVVVVLVHDAGEEELNVTDAEWDECSATITFPQRIASPEM